MPKGFAAMDFIEILFDMSIEQRCELGARGGRIHARNRRLSSIRDEAAIRRRLS